MQKQTQTKSFCGSSKEKNHIIHDSFIHGRRLQEVNADLSEGKWHPITICFNYNKIEELLSTKSELEDTFNKVKEHLVKVTEKIAKIVSTVNPNPDGKIIINKKTFDLINGDISYAKYERDKTEEGKAIKIEATEDYVLIVRFIIAEPSDVVASAAPYLFHSYSNYNRPYAGYLKIYPNSINFSKTNADKYFEKILLHEITHALVFHQDSFYFFEGENREKMIEDDDGKIYLATSKVIDMAKKHFGCNEGIKGMELENQGDENVQGNHWEGRLMMGDYMISSYYPEFQISDITLAVFEDSGWYRVKYYTGGLFRFGKNKGCDFLKNKCVNSDYTSTFNNEYCSLENRYDDMCTPSRTAQGICSINESPNDEYEIIDSSFKYYEGNSKGKKLVGSSAADYCPVPDIPPSEYNGDSYDVYSCNHGVTGGYHENSNVIYFNSTTGEFTPYKTTLDNSFENAFTDHSFCALSNIMLDTVKEGKYFDEMRFRAKCLEMFCSSKELTVKMLDEYVVCPRAGGQVNKDGKKGVLLCPDYNLICTGSAMCNDAFDCIEKESITKDCTYDYEIQTTQNTIPINSTITDIAWEEADDGKLVPFCIKGKEKSLGDIQCLRCKEDYVLVKYRDQEKKLCVKKEEFDDTGFYWKEDEITYYPCIENCDKCRDGIICDKCSNTYYMFEGNKKECKHETDEFMEEYYENDGDDGDGTYYRCDSKYNNCYSCIKSTCNKCKPNYYFLNYVKNTSNCCNPASQYGNKAYKENEENYLTCDYIDKDCQYCSDANTCDRCINQKVLIFDKRNECVSIQGKEDQYVVDDSNPYIYYPCNEKSTGCFRCKKESGKILCKQCLNDNFGLIYDDKICLTKEEMKDEYTYDNEKGGYRLCKQYVGECQSCTNTTSTTKECVKCMDTFTIVNDIKSVCELKINFQNNPKFITDDGGQNYRSCDTYLNDCLNCHEKESCDKCESNYGLVLQGKDNTDKWTCLSESLLEGKYYFSVDRYYPCGKGVTNCVECLTKTYCNKCDPTYVLIDDDRSTCELESEIKSTQKYYKVNDYIYKKCSQSIDYCNTCSLDGRTCLTCNANYGLTYDNKCININSDEYYKDETDNLYYPCYKSKSNCQKCSSKTECTKCNSSYGLVEQDSSSWGCISLSNLGDEYYTPDNIRYYLCLNKIDNCKFCHYSNPNVNCKQCTDLYILKDNDSSKCYLKSELESSQEYYKYSDTRYMLCSNKIDNCKTCNIQGTECFSCESGYNLYYNKKLCVSTSNTHYYLDSDNLAYPCDHVFLNCSTCSSKTVCQTCKDNFTKIISSSSSNIDACVQPSGYLVDCQTAKVEGDNYVCTECKYESYTLTENNICTSSSYCRLAEVGTGYCTTCKDSYVLNTSKNSCLSEDTQYLKNCKKCRSDYACTECKDGFYLSDDDKCVTTDHCIQGYYGKCTDCQLNYCLNKEDTCLYSEVNRCKECSDKYTCTTCASKNYLVSNTCQTCEELNSNCNSCKIGEPICTSCDSGYTLSLNNNSCFLSKDTIFINCIQTNNNGVICGKCLSGYFLDDDLGVCVDTDYCTDVDLSTGYCKSCDDKYIIRLSDYNCVSPVGYLINCKLASDGNNCSVCNTDHNSKDRYGVCSLVQHCREVNRSTGLCKKCELGYTFIQDTSNCLKAEDYFINCIEAEYEYSTECLQCIDNYFFEEYQNICSQHIDHCSSYDSYNRECFSCDYGYILTTDKQKCISKSILKHCSVAMSDSECYECESSNDIFMMNYQCKTCYELGCSTCNSDGTCKVKGKEIYTCNIEYCDYCYSSNHCDLCAFNYELNSRNKCSLKRETIKPSLNFVTVYNLYLNRASGYTDLTFKMLFTSNGKPDLLVGDKMFLKAQLFIDNDYEYTEVDTLCAVSSITQPNYLYEIVYNCGYTYSSDVEITLGSIQSNAFEQDDDFSAKFNVQNFNGYDKDNEESKKYIYYDYDYIKSNSNLFSYEVINISSLSYSKIEKNLLYFNIETPNVYALKNAFGSNTFNLYLLEPPNTVASCKVDENEKVICSYELSEKNDGNSKFIDEIILSDRPLGNNIYVSGDIDQRSLVGLNEEINLWNLPKKQSKGTGLVATIATIICPSIALLILFFIVRAFLKCRKPQNYSSNIRDSAQNIDNRTSHPHQIESNLNAGQPQSDENINNNSNA